MSNVWEKDMKKKKLKKKIKKLEREVARLSIQKMQMDEMKPPRFVEWRRFRDLSDLLPIGGPITTVEVFEALNGENDEREPD